MKSFDVFDTLIARRFVSNDIVLQTIERLVPGFVQARKQADNGQRSLDEIYQQLVDQKVCDAKTAEAAKKQEIALELETAIPIAENMRKVSHGDLLISDMYLPAHVIRELTRHAGLDKQVTIYQSDSDKNTGKIWKKLKNAGIECHTGDNHYSDVAQAKAHGINADLYPGTALVEAEQYLFSKGLQHLALLTREVRLRNVTQETSPFMIVATLLNLPWMFVTCEMLHRKHGDKHIVFLGRDGQSLQKIYSQYYGTCSYLPFSRKVAFADQKKANKYLKAHIPDNAVLFDIISTGGTWEKLNVDILVTVAIYSNLEHYTKHQPIPPKTFNYLTKNSDVGHVGFLLEVMNCADHGSISNITELTPGVYVSEFDKHELTTEVVEAIHTPVHSAVQLKQFYAANLRNELKVVSDQTLFEVFKALTLSICSQQQLNPLLQDFYKQEMGLLTALNDDKLTALANKFHSDKGTTYKCAHAYTKHYTKIFAPYLHKKFKLLEVGLNRDNQDSIPSLSIYKEYFDTPILYGFDIHPGFNKFNDPANDLHILIGDQSNPTDLLQVGDEQFDIIIDDGYHASMHQQITLKTLWDKLKPGGVFVVEDLHFQPNEFIETSVKTKQLLRDWQKGIATSSEWIGRSEVKILLNSVSSIELYDSASKLWGAETVKDAIAFIFKKG